MESWSFDSKANMGSMDWGSKSPFIFENNMVFSHNAVSIHQGFEATYVPEILGISSLSPIMSATHNDILEEHESSSDLSGSNGLFDLIAHVPSKQKRIRGSNSLPPLCKVQGCNTSLASCKDYHKRHKVCELHTKTAKVIVNGIEQRFCQQCSRFHLLSEFDGGKRSCRKRLADHNERRRNPHPGHYGRLVPPYYQKGSKFKGSTMTRAKSSSVCNDLRTMSCVTDIHQYPSLCGNNNGYAQASRSLMYPFLNEDRTGGEDDVITMDTTCALSLLSTQSHGSSSSCHSSRNPTSWPHPLSQNTQESAVSNNMSPLVGSDFMNSVHWLWSCEEVSTVDLLQLSSQLERVEFHKEIVRTMGQNGVQ